MFTKEQVELISMYYAASNTGLVGGIQWPVPLTIEEVKRTYNAISNDYASETGEGLEEELKMWKDEVGDQDVYIEMLQRVREEIPFILGSEKVEYKVQCIDYCKEEKIIKAYPADYLLWKEGARIQDVMPYLNVDDRELLISKICPPCWDKAFS